MNRDCNLHSKFYFSEIDDFQTIVGGFIDLMDNLSTEVEREKLKVSS